MASVYDQGGSVDFAAADLANPADYTFNGSFSPMPLAGTEQSILVGGTGADVFIAGNVEISGMTLDGTDGAIGGFFITLERATFSDFSDAVVLSRTGGVAFMKLKVPGPSSNFGLDSGAAVSFIERDLQAGTYFYRLSFTPQGRYLINGTSYSIKQTNLNIIQFARPQ